ncbi:hypothetical protein ACHIUC_08855 [Campylobacter coli]|uniref:hypothetical protein n=1 Tax=Campylobacter coli TaxID=195 RepID=UPI0037522B3E
MKLEINISANDIKEIHIEDVVYLYEKLNQEQQDLFLGLINATKNMGENKTIEILKTHFSGLVKDFIQEIKKNIEKCKRKITKIKKKQGGSHGK